MQKNNLFLIGPMGAGKSSIGYQLAKLLDKTFYDSDKEVQEAAGVDISWIFEKEGEAGFRKRELAMIEKLTALDNIVLSTGGGTIVTPACRDLLRQNGIVIYLNVSLPIQIKRTEHYRGHRPLIEEASDKIARLVQLNEERTPLYRQVAHHEYMTDDPHPTLIAKRIIAGLDQ